MLSKHNFVFTKTFLMFLIPFGLWAFIFQEMLSGQGLIIGDSHAIYSGISYYFETIRRGVFPLWNPFVVWGTPDLIWNNFFGIFNPIWLIIFILKYLGIHLYFAFVYVNVLYFFTGMMGFYLLSKIILKDQFGAYLCFLALLFSSHIVLENFTMFNLIYVPMVWFFYFWLRFFQDYQLKDFVGGSFVAMIAAVTYFPPYLLIVCFFVFISIFIFRFDRLKVNFLRSCVFLKKRSVCVLICLIFLSGALLSAYRAYEMSKNREVAFLGRHDQGSNLFLERSAEMDLGQIEYHSINVRNLLHQHFSDNLFMRGWKVDYVIIPFFCLLIFLMSAFNRMTRISAMIFFIGLFLFFVLLGPQGRVFVIFYRFLPFFKVVRSLFWLWPAFASIFIFFTILQWQIILRKGFGVGRKGRLLILFFVHFAGLILLIFLQNTQVSFYLTVFLSFIYFYFSLVWGKKIPKYILIVLAVICITIQPIEAALIYSKNSYQNINHKIYNIFTPIERFDFSYVRAENPGEPSMEMHLRHVLQVKDYVSFMGLVHFPCWWTTHVHAHIPREIIERYLQNKFYIYDHVKQTSGSPSPQDWTLAKNIFDEKPNVALVSLDGADENLNPFLISQENFAAFTGHARSFDGPETDFFVKNFEANSITMYTHFNDEKFLVYTDSYHKDWKLFINGEEQNLYRANIAFKGIIVPPGPNTIHLEFLPLGGSRTYFAIFLGYILMLIWVVYLFIFDSKILKKFRKHRT